MTIHVNALDDEHGIHVRDTSEGEAVALRTDRESNLEPASTDGFTMPVDTAVAIDAGELHASTFVLPIFWQDGAVVHRATRDDAPRLPRGMYEVDFSRPAVKLYVRVEDAEPTAEFVDDHTYLDLGAPSRVVVGIRSHHETPAGTVTTTDDPRDLMAAVSTFGSALKTHSPDRSWPTLRGHPPAIRRGDELDIPEEVALPDTGIRVEVPPEYGAIYTVSPLAYYLGASVEPGNRPRVIAEGRSYDLDADDLAGNVRSVLEHVFTLDCIIRVAGVYPFRTTAVDALEARVELEYERLFELPLAERTAEYLEVPRSATAGILEWHYTADVAADPAYAPALPYLVDELAVVRSPPQQSGQVDLTPSPNALRESDGALARSAADATSEPLSAVAPADMGTPGHSWIADDFSPSAANPTVGSFRRGFEWPQGDGALDVHVVYNDARLDASDETAYDTHQTAETNVQVSHSLTTSELREALYEETDFLHFVGHVTDEGMVCPNGTLDTRTLARTGVGAFFLNGCRSYEQGRALLTAGSVGGIVTVDDVADDVAGRVGHDISLLLDSGFPLYAVLDVLGRIGMPTDRYSILGSGTLAFRRGASGTPSMYAFDTDEFDTDSDTYSVSIQQYPYDENGMGTFVAPTYTAVDGVIANGGVRRDPISHSELERLLDSSPAPVLLDGELRYTPTLTMADFE
ncbi:hypothetical protein [Halobacterium noricense]|uniref:hypothetical protein n=1 Tax=Halobacterium noricense TaxID=223182 RepID=UPI001E3BFAAD|nr:hypothetical protein [Halobacterium noricense]UHH25086.1 hypothetical protein LT974_14025 [Halobacterium noricense]